MTSLIKLLLPLVFTALLTLSALPAQAQIQTIPDTLPGPGGGPSGGGPCGFVNGPSCANASTDTIIEFANIFIDMALSLVGIVAVIFLVYAGFKYITSRGDEEEAKRAKLQIIYAIIGITVAVGAKIIKEAFLGQYRNTEEIQRSILIPLIEAALTLVGIVAVIFLVYAGFKYITSRGDEEEAKTAKAQITYAILGIVVVALSVVIVNFIMPEIGGIDAPTNITGVYNETLTDGIIAVVEVLLTLTGLIAAIFLVYAGFKYITSRGDEEEAKTAKAQITYAILGIVVVALSVVTVNFILPEIGGIDAPTNINGVYNGTGLISGITIVVEVLLTLTGLIAAIFLVYAGVKYIISQGDEEEAKTAKTQIVYAIIGLTVVALSAAIVNLIVPVIGMNAITPFNGTSGGDVIVVITDVVSKLLALIGIVTLIFIVYAGVKYIISQGDEEEAKTAKTQIVYAILGLFIVFISALVINIVLRELSLFAAS